SRAGSKALLAPCGVGCAYAVAAQHGRPYCSLAQGITGTSARSRPSFVHRCRGLPCSNCRVVASRTWRRVCSHRHISQHGPSGALLRLLHFDCLRHVSYKVSSTDVLVYINVSLLFAKLGQRPWHRQTFPCPTASI